MKKLVLITLLICSAAVVMAQQPATQDSVDKTAPTKVAIPQSAQTNSAIHVLEPENMVLKAGVENLVRITVDKVSVSNMILKVVNEDVCAMRKGDELGTYFFTPKAKEGVVTVRVGSMDFMGAYYKAGDIEFTISAE
mgnify:CR=1 FL=1